MREKLKNRLTYANVMSTVAVFVALGGTSYGLATGVIDSREIRNNTVRSKDIRNRTITGRDVRRDSLGGGAIKESKLGVVPNADKLDGLDGLDLADTCPGGTRAFAGVCIDAAVRGVGNYLDARAGCQDADGDAGPGRRLPSYGELLAAGQTLGIDSRGEWTTHVYPASNPGLVNVLTVANPAGTVALALETTTHPYRCVAEVSNAR